GKQAARSERSLSASALKRSAPTPRVGGRVHERSTLSELTSTKRLSAHVAETRFEDLPPAVVELAKFKTFDMLGCLVYGVAVPAAAPAVRVALSRGGAPEGTIARERQRVPADLAALANGTASHSFEMDDRQPASALHPGSAMVPAGLAVAESRGLSGA